MHCKGVGARKLKYRLRQRFEGISEQRVQSVLSGSKLNQIVNAKFRNRAIGRPIRACAVQVSILQDGVTFKFVIAELHLTIALCEFEFSMS